jgi:hypothetical protein
MNFGLLKIRNLIQMIFYLKILQNMQLVSCFVHLVV